MRARTDARVAELGGPLAPRGGPLSLSTVPHPTAAGLVGARPDGEGWVNLFDGRRFSRWDGNKKLWSVKDKAITGSHDGTLKQNAFLTWKDHTLRNFELRAKVKVSANANSGIQYRSQSRPEIGLDVVGGYQCDVAPNAAINGMLYEERGRGLLSWTGEQVIIDEKGRGWVVGKQEQKPIAPDQWHEIRILVRGNHHQHWVNGQLTADLVDLQEDKRRLEGILALQLHGGKAMTVQYKDLRLKHLPDDLPVLTAADKPIPADAYGVRPLGKLPPNWKPPVFSEMEK